MKQNKSIFCLLVLVLCFLNFALAQDKKSEVDTQIVSKLKTQAEKSRQEIKEIQEKMKPLKEWIRENRPKWYPEQAYARSLMKTIQEKNDSIRDLLLESLRRTHDKAELYRQTMGVDVKYLKHMYLYLYYLTTKESPEKEEYSNYIFKMATESKTLKKCVICYNLIRVLKFVSKDAYIQRLEKTLKQAADTTKGGLNIIEGMKSVVKNLIYSGKSSKTFQKLFMLVKVVQSLKKSLSEKTLYYQRKVRESKKLSVYKRRIRNIRHIFYRMSGAEEKREKEEIKKQMTQFSKFRDLKIAELDRRKRRALAGIVTLKKILQKVQGQLDTIHSLTFTEYLKQENNKKK